jgi:hypothetical protein
MRCARVGGRVGSQHVLNSRTHLRSHETTLKISTDVAIVLPPCHNKAQANRSAGLQLVHGRAEQQRKLRAPAISPSNTTIGCELRPCGWKDEALQQRTSDDVIFIPKRKFPYSHAHHVHPDTATEHIHSSHWRWPWTSTFRTRTSRQAERVACYYTHSALML